MDNRDGDYHIYGNIDVEGCGGSMAVELVGFDAIGMDGYILLQWKVEVEIDNKKYLVFKRSEEREQYNLLVEVPASLSYTYIYKDTAVISGYEYWYKLGEVNEDNTVDWHGPVKVKYVARSASQSIYLDVVPSVGNKCAVQKVEVFKGGE